MLLLRIGWTLMAFRVGFLDKKRLDQSQKIDFKGIKTIKEQKDCVFLFFFSFLFFMNGCKGDDQKKKKNKSEIREFLLFT